MIELDSQPNQLQFTAALLSVTIISLAVQGSQEGYPHPPFKTFLMIYLYSAKKSKGIINFVHCYVMRFNWSMLIQCTCM